MQRSNKLLDVGEDVPPGLEMEALRLDGDLLAHDYGVDDLLSDETIEQGSQNCEVPKLFLLLDLRKPQSADLIQAHVASS